MFIIWKKPQPYYTHSSLTSCFHSHLSACVSKRNFELIHKKKTRENSSPFDFRPKVRAKQQVVLRILITLAIEAYHEYETHRKKTTEHDNLIKNILLFRTEIGRTWANTHRKSSNSFTRWTGWIVQHCPNTARFWTNGIGSTHISEMTWMRFIR